MPDAEGAHGSADAVMTTLTSPVAARQAVAAGLQATASIRGDGALLPVPPLDPELVAYFDAGQTA